MFYFCLEMHFLFAKTQITFKSRWRRLKTNISWWIITFLLLCRKSLCIHRYLQIIIIRLNSYSLSFISIILPIFFQLVIIFICPWSIIKKHRICIILNVISINLLSFKLLKHFKNCIGSLYLITPVCMYL